MESDKIVNKNQRRMFLSACVKCDWMREEHLSRDMFSALSTFLLQQCSMTILYSPAHRDTLLCNTLDVCLKVSREIFTIIENLLMGVFVWWVWVSELVRDMLHQWLHHLHQIIF